MFSRKNMNNNETEKLQCQQKPHKKLREIENGSWQPKKLQCTSRLSE